MKPRPAPRPDWLRIHGARQNNLKNVSVAIPHDRVTVVTGVSGSGKSSLAFDTIFAEGQWRFIESLSSYARMFLERIDRPDVDLVEHIRPAIALEQKNPVRTARSTVGTATELADYLRLLYAKIGRVHCPRCGRPAGSAAPDRVADALLAEAAGARVLVGFPLPVPAADRVGDLLARLVARGFARIKVGDEVLPLSPLPDVDLAGRETVDVILDRLLLRPESQTRLAGSFEQAFREGGGRAVVEIQRDGRPAEVRRYGEQFGCQACGTALERPSPCSSPSTTRSARAPSARGSETSSATTRAA